MYSAQSESDNSLATQYSSLKNSLFCLFLIRLDTYTNMKALRNYLVQYEQIYHRDTKTVSSRSCLVVLQENIIYLFQDLEKKGIARADCVTDCKDMKI